MGSSGGWLQESAADLFRCADVENWGEPEKSPISPRSVENFPSSAKSKNVPISEYVNAANSNPLILNDTLFIYLI